MRRAELEHVIRAAATVAEDEEIVVVGSQAVLGQFPDAPESLLISREADVYPRNRPERTDEIEELRHRASDLPISRARIEAVRRMVDGLLVRARAPGN